MAWKKGQSGNPRGRKPEENEVKGLAKSYTAEAIKRLVDWMRSDNPKASVQAASALLDRGHGKPAQQIEIEANVRQCDVSAEPLPAKDWDERYSASRPN